MELFKALYELRKKTFPPISIEHAQNLHLYSKFAIQKSKSDLCMFFLP